MKSFVYLSKLFGYRNYIENSNIKETEIRISKTKI